MEREKQRHSKATPIQKKILVAWVNEDVTNRRAIDWKGIADFLNKLSEDKRTPEQWKTVFMSLKTRVAKKLDMCNNNSEMLNSLELAVAEILRMLNSREDSLNKGVLNKNDRRSLPDFGKDTLNTANKQTNQTFESSQQSNSRKRMRPSESPLNNSGFAASSTSFTAQASQSIPMPAPHHAHQEGQMSQTRSAPQFKMARKENITQDASVQSAVQQLLNNQTEVKLIKTEPTEPRPSGSEFNSYVCSKPPPKVTRNELSEPTEERNAPTIEQLGTLALVSISDSLKSIATSLERISHRMERTTQNNCINLDEDELLRSPSHCT